MFSKWPLGRPRIRWRYKTWEDTRKRKVCLWERMMAEAYHRITEPDKNINRFKHNHLKSILHWTNLYQFYLKYNKTTTTFYVLRLVPAFVGPHQRSSSFWLVLKNLEWDPWAGHSRNKFFFFKLEPYLLQIPYLVV
jgi:hypothetical protein